MNHRLIPALALGALLAVGGAVTVSAQGTQQDRMRLCNTDANARHLMGADRRQFMSTCLSKRGREHMTMNRQQRKMKDCSAEAKAKGFKGAARKMYMSDCLKGR
jgi:psiF repeat-containing protein